GSSCRGGRREEPGEHSCVRSRAETVESRACARSRRRCGRCRVRALRRRRAPRTAAPPVAVPEVLALYAWMAGASGVSVDSPSVLAHLAECRTAVSYVRASWPPEACTCPARSGFPRVVATVADGWEPLAVADTERPRGEHIGEVRT